MTQQQTQTQHYSTCHDGRIKSTLLEQLSTLSIQSKISEKHRQEQQKQHPSSQISKGICNCLHKTLKGHQLVTLFDRLRTRRLNKSFIGIINYSQRFITQTGISVFSSRVNQNDLQTQSQSKKQLESNYPIVFDNIHKYTSSVKSNIFLKQFKNQNSTKNLHRQLFKIKLQNSSYQAKVKCLEDQLQQILKRQQKEVAKKKSSLEGLVLELSQKNQKIQQQQVVIKSLQSKLKCKDNGLMHLVLQQDGQSLRRVVFRLENINDKLNNDLQRKQRQKQIIETQNQEMKQENHQLKLEIKQLKQQLFEFQHSSSQTMANKRELQIMAKKLNNKIGRIKNIDLKINDIKKKQIISSSDIVQMLSFKSDGKMTQTTQTMLQRSQQMRQLEAQEKIESIFTYLFNIQDQFYEIHQSRLFDAEQKQFLASHKQKYLTNFKLTKSNLKTPINKIRSDVSAIQNNPFDLSILQIFQQNDKNQHSQYKDKINKLSMKLIDLQREKGYSIDKISELKKKQLHIRSLILIFLKSLELKSLKKQCESILQIIFDFYQYSQDQKLSIFQQAKSKKFFGLL